MQVWKYKYKKREWVFKGFINIHGDMDYNQKLNSEKETTRIVGSISIGRKPTTKWQKKQDKNQHKFE